MIEVELKARVPDRDTTLAWLNHRSTAEASIYRDTYYDWPDSTLENNGRQELRVRIIETDHTSRVLFTYKGAMLDAASTPEHETTVTDATALDAILTNLGLEPVIAYEKHCLNYTFHASDHDITTTVVQVPELGGDTFVEIETLVPSNDQIDQATKLIHTILTEIGLGAEHLAPEFYVDMVRHHRTT